MKFQPNIPSSIPPWSRPNQSPATQYVVGNDTIDLGCDVTYINQITPQPAVAPAASLPYALTIPNGTYLRQIKRIYIPGSTIANTAPFTLSGNFAGFNSLLFNNAASSAILEWDGTAWQMAGGNAQQSTNQP